MTHIPRVGRYGTMVSYRNDTCAGEFTYEEFLNDELDGLNPEARARAMERMYDPATGTCGCYGHAPGLVFSEIMTKPLPADWKKWDRQVFNSTIMMTPELRDVLLEDDVEQVEWEERERMLYEMHDLSIAGGQSYGEMDRSSLGGDVED